MRRWAGIVILASLSAACSGEATAPASVQGTYILASIGGQPLPHVPLTSQILGGKVPVVSGSVTLGRDGLADEVTRWADGTTGNDHGSFQLSGNLVFVWRPGAVNPSYTYEWDGRNTLRQNSGGEQWVWERQ